MKCNPDMDESAVLAGRGCATVSPISGLRFISPPYRFPRNAFQLETIHSADRALMTSSISIKSTRLWTTCVKGSVLLCPCVGRFSSQTGGAWGVSASCFIHAPLKHLIYLCLIIQYPSWIEQIIGLGIYKVFLHACIWSYITSMLILRRCEER